MKKATYVTPGIKIIVIENNSILADSYNSYPVNPKLRLNLDDIEEEGCAD